jgi:hypothetical protein
MAVGGTDLLTSGGVGMDLKTNGSSSGVPKAGSTLGFGVGSRQA